VIRLLDGTLTARLLATRPFFARQPRSRRSAVSYKPQGEVEYLRRGSRRGAYGTDDGDDNITRPREGSLPCPCDLVEVRAGECRRG